MATRAEHHAEVSTGRSSNEGRETGWSEGPNGAPFVGASKQQASKPSVAVTTKGQPDFANAESSTPEQSGEAATAPRSSVWSERANERQESPGQNERLMEQVADRANLNAAWRRVRANGGAPGNEGITLEAFPAHLGCAKHCSTAATGRARYDG